MTKDEIRKLVDEADELVKQLSDIQREVSNDQLDHWEVDDFLNTPEFALFSGLWMATIVKLRNLQTRNPDGSVRQCDLLTESVPLALAWAAGMGEIIGRSPTLGFRLADFYKAISGNPKLIRLIATKTALTQGTEDLHRELNERIEDLFDD